jgi:hypothetical protein
LPRPWLHLCHHEQHLVLHLDHVQVFLHHHDLHRNLSLHRNLLLLGLGLR